FGSPQVQVGCFQSSQDAAVAAVFDLVGSGERQTGAKQRILDYAGLCELAGRMLRRVVQKKAMRSDVQNSGSFQPLERCLVGWLAGKVLPFGEELLNAPGLLRGAREGREIDFGQILSGGDAPALGWRSDRQRALGLAEQRVRQNHGTGLACPRHLLPQEIA